MPKSSLLTLDNCDHALAMTLPSIEHCMRSGPYNREAGQLIVLNPTRLYEPKYHDGPDNDAFKEEVVFWTHLFGSPEEWEHPFAEVALAKAYASFKYRLPADVIVDQAPELLEPGMTKYGGSAVCPISGLVVAFSGVQAHFDKQISQALLNALKALCKGRMLEIAADPDVRFMPSPDEENEANAERHEPERRGAWAGTSVSG